MNTASLLIILLSTSGHWLGGRTGTINVQWSATPPATVVNTATAPSTATLIWRLSQGSATLASGRTILNDQGQTIEVPVPAVRARVTMTWNYDLLDAGGSSLETGQRVIHVWPDNLLEGLADRLAGRDVLVWDSGAELAACLEHTGVKVQPISDPSALSLVREPIVFVAAGQELSTWDQGALADAARNGASVMLFEQDSPSELMGWHILRRPAPDKLEWRLDHPLLRSLDAQDVTSWLSAGKDLSAIELPPDTAALEIAYWPFEIDAKQPPPVQAMLVSQTLGQGRIVLCQLPLGPWGSDPRSMQLLVNALDYLATRPAPTPPPSQRPTRQVIPAPVVPSIPLDGGGS